MERVVLDTSIIIDHVRGTGNLLTALLKAQAQKKLQLIAPSVVLFEFYSGSSLDKKAVLDVADLLFSQFTTHNIDEETAKYAARLNRMHKLQNHIESIDILISAVCFLTKAKLATNNKKHFQLVPHLSFYN